MCVFQAMFLNVLFKSMKSDPSMNRVKVEVAWTLSHTLAALTGACVCVVVQAFVKRMLHVSTCHSPSFVCGCLVLLSEVYMRLCACMCVYVYTLLAMVYVIFQ